MLIYITGPPGVGKTKLLSKLDIPSIELDDIFDNNCKKYTTYTKVQEECKRQVEELVTKYSNIIFTGFQTPDELFFKPDLVILLVRYDYVKYYKQILNDRRYFGNNYLNYFSNNLKTLIEFIRCFVSTTKLIKEDYPNAITLDLLKAKEYIQTIKMDPDSYLE